MNPRRLLIVSAVMLGLLALSASLGTQPPPAPRDAPAPPPPAAEGGAAARLSIDAARPPSDRLAVAPERRVALTVRVPAPGQVILPELGRVAAAEPAAPAAFDLFTERAGRFRVLYEPLGRRVRRVALIVVR